MLNGDNEITFEDDALVDLGQESESDSKNDVLVICSSGSKALLQKMQEFLSSTRLEFIEHDTAIEKFIETAHVIILECRLIEGFADLLLLRKLRQLRPLAPVVLVSKNDDPDFIVEAYHAGATDYCLIDMALQVLGAKIDVFNKMSQAANIIELQNREVVASLKAQRQAFEQKLEAEKAKAQIQAEVEITRRTKEILDNLSEAFFTVEKNLRIGATTSAAARDIFGIDIADKEIDQAFPFLNRDQAIFFRLAIEQTFDGFMPLNVCIDTIPKRLNTANDKVILFRFTPIMDTDGNLLRLIGCGVDITFQVKRAAEFEQKVATNTALITILEDPWVFVGFLQEVDMHLKELTYGELNKSQTLFILHTLKGNFSAYSLIEISSAIHRMETDLKEMESKKDIYDHIQDCAEKIRQHICSFLTQFLNVLKISPDKFEVNYLPVSKHDLGVLRQHISLVPEDYIKGKLKEWLTLLEFVTFERMLVPIQMAAQQLAGKQEKKVIFKVNGGQIKLDQKRFGGLINSLIHALRNSIDHGIELPEEREMLNKPIEGTITFSAQYLESNELVVDIFDDGRGVDPQYILERALEKKMISEGDRKKYPQRKAFQLLFLEGFSTRDEVSEVSGRGVGVSSIKEEVKKLGGKMYFNAEVGKGTRLKIVIPQFLLPLHSGTCDSAAA